MRIWAAVAAVPVVVFLAAFGATLLSGQGSGSRAEGRIIVALEQASGLPASSLFSVRTDGSGLDRITSAPRGGFAVTALDMQADWSRAAGLVVFARETFAANGTGTPPKLYSVRPDGSRLRRLTEGPAVDRHPAWSPDGRRIAFAKDTEGAFELFVMEADGSRAIQLTADPATADEFPAWSPDGRRIAFASTAGGDSDLSVVGADGVGGRSLTGGPNDDSAPDWSPDGAQIAFLRDGHVHVMAADGTQVRRLTGGRPGYARPRWSPDGSSVLSADDRGSVFVLSADGDTRTRVPLSGTAAWPVWHEGDAG